MIMGEMDAGRTLDQDTDLRTLVLRCGDARMPRGVAALQRVDVASRPGRADVDALLVRVRRLVVVGDDADLAAVLTRLMRTERLDVELAYVGRERSPATRVWSLPTGDRAAALAVDGSARPVALARDDAGVALVGRATLTGSPLTGESYADNTRLFSGATRRVVVEPTAEGVRASLGRLRPWVSGRAVQTGTTGLVLTRDGVEHERVVKRSTFYRHTTDWLLVR